MAFKPNTAKMPKPAPDDDEDETGIDAPDGNQGTDDQEDAPGEESEEGGDEDEGSEVIATILKNEDGSYTLIHGDEEEGGEDEGESGEVEDEGEEGEGDQASPERQVFQTEGELLKGVLDCIRADKGEDDSSAEHDFAGGYNEEKGPMQAPPTAGRNAMA